MQPAESLIAANSVEQEYLITTSSQHRKKFAQFFTPPKVADFMAKWLLTHPHLEKILEPAYGLGIFSRTLLQYKSDLNIKGFETDAVIFAKASALFSNHKNITLQLQDYMSCDWENKYDGIICNPPYFKFHDYDNKTIIKELETRISCKLNGFSNLYALFLLKSISQLNENGRAAYIVPSEFLNSDYGKLIKAQLINSQTLRHIIIIHFSENVFDKALTTACILLLANDKQAEVVQFHTINSIADTQHLEKIISVYPKRLTQSQVFSFSELNPDIKWRAYYQPQNTLKYKNLVPFSDYAKTMRGIATGANQYFIFNQSKAIELQISNDYLLPCICKSSDIKQPFFTKEHFDLLKKADKNTFLLNSTNPVNSDLKAVNDYLKLGTQQGIDKKFLTASRKPWHALEKRPPAPIWVSVFNRTGLKLIRNEVGIANLTTFHGIYPNSENSTPEKINLLFAYLLTDIAKALFADNRREYGNGLEKFEPNDINKAQMLNLNDLDEAIKQDILKYYNLYRKSVLENNPNQSLITYINKILTVQFS